MKHNRGVKGDRACSSKQLKKKEAAYSRAQSKGKEGKNSDQLLHKQLNTKVSNARRKAKLQTKTKESPSQKTRQQQKLVRNIGGLPNEGKVCLKEPLKDNKGEDFLRKPSGSKKEEIAGQEKELQELEEQLTDLQKQLEEKCIQEMALKEQVNVDRQRIIDLQGELRANEQEMSTMSEQLSYTRGQILEKDGNMATLQKEIATRQQQLTDLQNQLSAKEEEIRMTREQSTNFSRQGEILQRKQQRVRDLQNKLRTNEQQIRAMELEINDLREQLEEKDATLPDEIETGRQQVIDLQSELRSKDEEIRKGEQQLTDLHEKLEEKDANLVTAQGEARAEHQRVTDLQRQLTTNEQEMRTMEQQMIELREQLEEKDATLQEEIETGRRQVIDLQSELRSKDEEIRKGEQQLTDLREKLEEKDANLVTAQGEARAEHQRVTDLQRQLTTNEQEMRAIEQQMIEFREQLEEKDALQEEIETGRRQVIDLQSELRSKDEEIRKGEQQLTDLREQLEEKDASLVTAQGEARAEHQRIADLRRQLTTNEQQMRTVEQQMIELREQLGEKDTNVATLQRMLRAEQQRVSRLQNQLTINEREMTIMEQRLTDLREEGEHYQLRVEEQHVLRLPGANNEEENSANNSVCSADWIIDRSEIEIGGKQLGQGGWGRVVEGKYHRCAVAVKQLYESILSPCNRNKFLREMNMASRCRHPCLLQFIGATNDEGNPLFVTELMETSLRALIDERHLTDTEVSVICLDVALALNYLHKEKPRKPSIIHRDISSANVLLWRQKDQWRGKVSDYGTVNFTQHSKTIAPGAPIYSAPEALSIKQTTKVSPDVIGINYVYRGSN